MRSISTLFNDAWSHVTSNLNLFVGIYAIPVVVGFIGEMFITDSVKSGTMSAAIIGFALVMVVVNILGSVALLKAVMQPTGMTIGNAYQVGKQYFWSYLFLSILVSLAVVGGLILLIIPGIIFGIWFSLAYFALLGEDKRGTQAMKASREYVRGHWWAVFGRMVLLVVVLFVVGGIAGFIGAMIIPGNEDMVVSLVTYLLNLVVVPFALAYSYFIYKDLKALKDGSGEVAEVEQVQDVAEAV